MLEGLTISVADILWIAAALSTLTAAWKIIKNNPIAKHEKRFEKDEKRLDDHDEKLARDLARLQDAEAADKIMCKCLLALIDHEITGNGTERMKQIRTELQQYLIDK
ncbi:hypothetical protein [Holdemania sp. Marseille-P2844]|jgi:hypothetical protein|uniref:hypothetical protein n=1 Tax=Holdemania sp. Marseille-P2844 TaxID=1852366 RepID=UPI0009325D05|nr:hypothetical protein [Holdemania sp. Marseille-P2844]